MISLIFTISLLTISIIFAVQNASDVLVKFLFWEFSWPLVLIIFLFFAIGLVVGLLAIVPRLVKNKQALSKERQKTVIKNFEDQSKTNTISEN